MVDLELLQNARIHLDQIATEYRRQAKREAKGQLGDIEERYEAEHKRLAQLKSELHELREERQRIETQLNVIEAKLENLPDTCELQGRRSEVERERNRVQVEIDRLKALVRSLASTAGLKLANQPALTLITELDSRRQRGEIPKTVSQTLLKDLLKLKRCLCGTQFEDNDQIYQTLLNRLKAEQNKSSQQELLDLLMALKTASELISRSCVKSCVKKWAGHYLVDIDNLLNFKLRMTA